MEEENKFIEEPREHNSSEHALGDDQPEDESNDVLKLAKDKGKKPDKAAFTINFYSWSTPIIGLVMLLFGLAAGYFLRPIITGEQDSADPQTGASAGDSIVEVSTPNPDTEAVLNSLYQQVRHFKGDENAPITIIEFSDFQ